ncbi:MAG: hypothetical protein U9M95_06410 [Candidatus Altiarchaeota archaeon]|nr:hypothetical protein [Candidatus Altiarchaeota archaeon]
MNDRLFNLYDGECQIRDCGFYKTYFSRSREKILPIFEATKIGKMRDGAPQGDLGNTLCLCPNHSKVLDNCGHDLFDRLENSLLDGSDDDVEIKFSIETPDGSISETLVYNTTHMKEVKNYLNWLREKQKR